MNALLTLTAFKAFTKFTAGKCTSNKCLVGKTAIITGSTSGIGYEATKQLASRGCRIYMNGLLNLNEDIVDLLRYAFNNQELYYRKVNLASFESVREFSEFFKGNEKKLDILIHNAEALANPYIITSDKLIQVMQVNYLSPFLMTHLLQDQLKATPGGRVVFVGNVIAYFRTLDKPFDPTHHRNTHNNLMTLMDFSNSKCGQMVIARLFAEKFKPHKITCNVVYPGWIDIEDRKVHNNIDVDEWYYDVCKIFLDAWVYVYGKTRLEGSQMLLQAALAPHLTNTTGKFIMDHLHFPLPYYTSQKELREQIWQQSENLCQLRPEEKLV